MTSILSLILSMFCKELSKVSINFSLDKLYHGMKDINLDLKELYKIYSFNHNLLSINFNFHQILNFQYN